MPRYSMIKRGDVVELLAIPNGLHFDPEQPSFVFVAVQGKLYACNISPLRECRIVVTDCERRDGVIIRFHTTESDDELKQWEPPDHGLDWNDHTFGYRLDVEGETGIWNVLVEYNPMPHPPAQPVPETRIVR